MTSFREGLFLHLLVAAFLGAPWCVGILTLLEAFLGAPQ